MLEIILLAITSFIGTNIDDLIIDIFFFLASESKKDICNTVLGKYLGIGFLVIISMMGALGLEFLPTQYIGCLGLIPIGLGIKNIINSIQNTDEEIEDVNNKKSLNMMWNVALITIVNGADNIGVYIPLFAGFSGNQYIIFLIVFIIMIALWCVLGYVASKVPLWQKVMIKYKKVIVPGVYILLGIYILLSNIG